MKTHPRRSRLAPLLLGGIVLLMAPRTLPLAEAKTRIDAEKIYLGDFKKYKRPAVVDAMKVYRKIPAHQAILDRKLTRNDPDYWPLLRKAGQAFVRALRRVCQERGYDLVGESGTIAIDGETVPEITAEVIEMLDRPEKPKGDEKSAARAAPRRAPPPATGEETASARKAD